jgi:hypothetical protein
MVGEGASEGAGELSNHRVMILDQRACRSIAYNSFRFTYKDSQWLGVDRLSMVCFECFAVCIGLRTDMVYYGALGRGS